jgi:hypothetical protein
VIQAASSPHKYADAGIVPLATSGLASVHLNFEGAKCLVSLGSGGAALPQGDFEDATEYCVMITYSYIYTLSGVVSGSILISAWAFTRRKMSHAGE